MATRREGYSSSRSFGWLSFLKPDLLKLALAFLMPAIVALLVTGRTESVPDFYDYLLKPMMGVWTGAEVAFVFNRFVLLWVPFYLTGCTIARLARGALS